jgi:hypothetical protein
MPGFKITMRKNGRAVGEMSYGSEAVAVTQAAAMSKAAPGTTVTVASAKSNPRRNGGSESVMWTVRVGSQEIGDIHAAPQVTAALVDKAAKLAAEQGVTASMFKRFGSVSDGMARRSVAPFLKNGHICRNPSCGCKANPRRNGETEGRLMASLSQRAQFERRQNGATGTLDLRQSRILSWKEIDAAAVGGKLIKAPMHALGGSLRFTVYERKPDGWHPIRVFVRPAYPTPTTKDLFDGVAAYKSAPGDIVKTRTTPGTSPYDSTTFYEDLKYQTLRSYDASLFKKR